MVFKLIVRLDVLDDDISKDLWPKSAKGGEGIYGITAVVAWWVKLQLFRYSALSLATLVTSGSPVILWKYK